MWEEKNQTMSDSLRGLQTDSMMERQEIERQVCSEAVTKQLLVKIGKYQCLRTMSWGEFICDKCKRCW